MTWLLKIGQEKLITIRRQRYRTGACSNRNDVTRQQHQNRGGHRSSIELAEMLENLIRAGHEYRAAQLFAWEF
jgi:hypothetical protein